jgi:hypothetical protein
MNNDQMEFMFMALSGESSADIITSQESQAQHNLVNSTTLPIRNDEDWKTLKSWGVVQGKPVDDLFCNATLPDGWQKKPTGHSLWTDLLDSRGLKRASMFYKGAFYDRDAFINAIPFRFVASSVTYLDFWKEKDPRIVPAIRDACKDIFVQVFHPIFMGYDSTGNLGVVMNGEFYYGVVGDYDKAQFTKVAPTDRVNAVRITMKEFYERFHNREVSNYHLLCAADNMAEHITGKALESYPTGADQWDDQYDFPEVVY